MSNAQISSMLADFELFQTMVDLFTEHKKSFYEDLKPEIKKKIYMELRSICKGFLVSPDYKSGVQTLPKYKVCCEIVDYCSFYYQTWFYLICTAAGCILLNIVALLVVFLICRKGKEPKGCAPPKAGKSPIKKSNSKALF